MSRFFLISSRPTLSVSFGFSVCDGRERRRTPTPHFARQHLFLLPFSSRAIHVVILSTFQVVSPLSIG